MFFGQMLKFNHLKLLQRSLINMESHEISSYDNEVDDMVPYDNANPYIDSVLKRIRNSETASIILENKKYHPSFRNLNNFFGLIAPFLKLQRVKRTKFNLREQFVRHVSCLKHRFRIHKASTASNMEIYLMLTGQTLPDYYIKLLIFYAYWDDWLDEGEDREYTLDKFNWVRNVFIPSLKTKDPLPLLYQPYRNVTQLPPKSDLLMLHGWIYHNPKRDAIISLFFKLIDCEIEGIQPYNDFYGMRARIYSAFNMLKAAQTVYPFFGEFYEMPNWPENITVFLSIIDDLIDIKQDHDNNQWTYFNQENPFLTLIRVNECIPILYECLEKIMKDTLKESYIESVEIYVFSIVHVCVYSTLKETYVDYPDIAEQYYEKWKDFMFPKEEHENVLAVRDQIMKVYKRINIP